MARKRHSVFEQFVREYGVARLASQVGVGETAVRHWLSGSTSPHPATAITIRDLAAKRSIRLSLDKIYLHFQQVGSPRYAQVAR